MVDLNTEVEDVGGSEAPIDTSNDSARSERLTVRESLERSFEDARRDERKVEEPRKRTTNRRASERQPEEEVETEQAEPEVKEPTVTGSQTQPPASWSKQAKATWGELPQPIQAEVLKREQDMERGVKELQQKYTEIDNALAPHVGAIKQFNKSPAEAISQLFGWFQALSLNPDQAFPALIQSYNYDPKKLLAAFKLEAAPQAQAETKKEVQPEEEISPAVQQYINKLQEEIYGFKQQVGQQFNAFQNNFAEQSMAKTHDLLNTWAKDKPYFEQVRTMMGHLLTPDPTTGVAAVPLKDGKVDLDTAYNMAIYAMPEIRSKLIADEMSKAESERQAKLAAEAKAQQDRADKARKASSSITTSAPGADVGKKKVVKGKSVRESLRDALEEHRG